MAKTAAKATPPLRSIEILAARLQKIINSPTAQKAQAAVIHIAPDEAQEDWDQIMEAITETDGVYVTLQEDGSTRVHWDVPEKD